MPATPAWPPRSPPRLFVAGPLDAGRTVELDAQQANYLGNVMRLGPGGQVLLFDGQSGEWSATVGQSSRKAMTLTVGDQVRPLEQVPDLDLAFAPVKRAPLDWLVEKATELGVARLAPVITRRTVIDRVRTDRMRSIAIEAAEQCGRTALPTVLEPVPLTDLLARHSPARALYFADETGGDPPSLAFVPGPARILTGPEGGFTVEERAMIRATSGARAISLGPRILRAETAALAAVAAWMALAGDWRGP